MAFKEKNHLWFNFLLRWSHSLVKGLAILTNRDSPETLKKLTYRKSIMI